jgi:quercetin dioxygenase-like cupin family protein
MTRHALLAITLMIASTTAPVTVAGQAKKPALHERTATVVLPDAVNWGPAPPALPAGAKAAMLEGDPAKKGPFTVRLSFPDNYQLAPHFHTAPEHVTVIKGKLKVGMGEKFDESQMQTLPSGAFGMIPTGMRHYAKADGETIIQLHGTGPWKLIYVNKADDPRRKVATK